MRLVSTGRPKQSLSRALRTPRPPSNCAAGCIYFCCYEIFWLYLDAEVVVLPPPVLSSGLCFLLAADLRRHQTPLPALLSNMQTSLSDRGQVLDERGAPLVLPLVELGCVVLTKYRHALLRVGVG